MSRLHIWQSRSIGVLLTLLWMGARAFAQPGAQLSGSVLDATGLPLTGATITLRGAAHRVTRTGPDGQFDFTVLPEGEYELTAALRGFVPARQTTRLVSGQRAIVSLTLAVQILEHTVVTAEKTGEADVQATPMAVSVLTGARIAGLQDRTVENIAGRVPGLTFSQNIGYAQITIRGIGTNVLFAGGDPSSAVYLDGVYLARPAMVLTDFLELDRVEVLRGPQGTLYGRNRVGGAVNLVTRSPTDDVETSARVGGGDHGTFRAEARVSGPIVGGKVMGSAAILRGVQTGFVRDVDHPDHALGGKDVVAGRGQLRVVLNPRSELHVAGDVNHNEPTPLYYSKVLAVKPGFHVDNPTDLHDVRTSAPAEGRNLQYGGSARLTLDLTPSTRMTSLSAFRKQDYDFVADQDITELDLTVTRVHDMQHQFSEELTVSHRDPRLTWIAGLFLFDEVNRMPVSIREPQPGLVFQLDPHVEARARALFGQATVGLTGRLAVTAGLRYTHERKTIDIAGGNYTIGPPMTLVADSSYAFADAISHDAWTPKVGVEVRARDGVLAYAPPHGDSRVVASTSRRRRPDAGSPPSGRGVMKVG